MSNAQRDIRRKQQVLEYAKQIRNIRKTCRHVGIPRSLFYVWRGAFQREEEAGLSSTSARWPGPLRRPRAQRSWNRSCPADGPTISRRSGSCGIWPATTG